MNKALYRKYRSRSLSEIVGQEHITKTLSNALKNGKLSHAYLFTGPRGVGKTSIARILAHEINELPYTDESTHLDIIEIDAASNRRIDEIRDLRDKVHIAPTSSKFKVYIIDEVHMLTREAFNALLKTLEEPPAHVVFILATTELHKLPETIISRTQRFTFKPIDQKSAVTHLAEIAKSEKIDIDIPALELLALHGRGSFRDSISLLDQVRSSGKKITKEDVESTIGLASSEHIENILNAISANSPMDVVAALNGIAIAGINPSQVAKQLSAALREQILEGRASDKTLELLTDLLGVSSSSEPLSALEIAIFKAAISPSSQPQIVETKITSQEPKSQALSTSSEKTTKKPAEPAVKPKDQKKAEENDYPDEQLPVSGQKADWWEDVLNNVKKVNNTLYGVLRMADTKVDNDVLHLTFGFGFHKKKVDDKTTQAKIHEAIKQITGKNYKINAVVDKNAGKQTTTKKSSEESNDNGLASITDVFGGAEVLES